MLPCNGNVNASPRKLSCKLVIGGNTITQVKSLTYNSGWSGAVSIGNVISSCFSCTLPTPSFGLAGATVTLSMGIGDPVEWVQIGSFKIDEESVRSRQGYTSFNAFDKLYKNTLNIYHSALVFPATLQAICNEVCSQIGITSTTLPVNPTINENMFDGYTLRDVLGYIAAYCGRNAYLSPSGVLDLRWYSSTSYTADGTRANVPYIGENNCTINRLICQTADGVLTSGSGEGMYFMCPFMTQARLDTLQAAFSGFTYRKADVDIPFGNFLIQAGDIITVTTTGMSLTVPVMSNSWSFDGGLHSNLSSYGVGDYSGTANNCERSLSMVRRQYIMNEKRSATRISEEIEHATEVITGATGGIMRINMGSNGKPAELLILDTGDINTATRVFRLNENGLGYAYNSNGNAYAGPYATAITADGLIVTDRFVGNLISGVAIESTDNGAQVMINSGNYEINQVSGGIVSSVGKIGFKPQTSQTNVNTMAIEVENGGAIVIGEVGYPKIVFYSNPASGALPLHVYDNIRFYYDVELQQAQTMDHSSHNLIDIINELQQKVAALENQ